MAVVSRTKKLSSTLDASMGSTAPQIYDYPAAEAIESGQVVKLDGTGLVLAAAGDSILGFAGRSVGKGQRLTVFGPGARFGGFTGLTPGALLYAGADGELDTTGDDGNGVDYRPIARAITATDIQVIAFY